MHIICCAYSAGCSASLCDKRSRAQQNHQVKRIRLSALLPYGIPSRCYSDRTRPDARVHSVTRAPRRCASTCIHIHMMTCYVNYILAESLPYAKPHITRLCAMFNVSFWPRRIAIYKYIRVYCQCAPDSVRLEVVIYVNAVCTQNSWKVDKYGFSLYCYCSTISTHLA